MTEKIQAEFNANPIVDYINSVSSVRGKETLGLAVKRAVSIWLGKPISELTGEELFFFPFSEITQTEIKALKAMLLKRYSRATTAQTLSAVKGVLGAAFDLGLITGDQLKRIERVSSVKVSANPTVGRYITPNEIEKIKTVLELDNTAAGVRDLAIIGWLWCQGARVSDITGAELRDFNAKTGRIVIREGKGGKDRENLLHNGALRAMQSWVKVRGSWSGALFTPIDNKGKVIRREKPLTRYAISKMLDKRRKQAGLEPFSCHDFRRSAATALIETIGIRKAQIILGHSSIETTARYDRGNLDAALNAAEIRAF